MRASGAPHIPWRARPARWLATRSLRGQLISGLMALLALACAGVGLVTYIVISHTLLSQLDYQLQAAGGRYASCMEAQHHEGPPLPQGATAANCNATPGLNAGTFGARVKDGMVTDQGIIGGQSHLSAADEATLTRLPPDGRYYTEDLDSIHGEYRLTAIKGLDGDVLITGLPLAPVQSTLRKVEIAELAAFLAALVLANLMSNAAKHTPAGTTVTVALAAGQTPATIELTVTDNGPGIPPDLQPTLFERFVRGDSARSRGTAGAASTGLGLAIVNAVTTAHGGQVRVNSKPGHTQFAITLPRLYS